MPDIKKPYRVVQEGQNGAPIEVNGQMVKFNDTVMLTDLEARYYIGMSIEPAFPKDPATPVGEHRESGADIVGETRVMREPELHEDDVRSSKRAPRSTPNRA